MLSKLHSGRTDPAPVDRTWRVRRELDLRPRPDPPIAAEDRAGHLPVRLGNLQRVSNTVVSHLAMASRSRPIAARRVPEGTRYRE
jgi:hypothetical protein